MEIELRQHQDGSFILEVQNGSSKKEVDVTHVIHEIFHAKLKELQARVRMEEKYRNWVVEAAQQSNTAVSTALSRYELVIERLKQTNEAITIAITSWQQKKDLKDSMTQLQKVSAQSQHFLQNDTVLQTLKDLKNKNT